MNELITLIDEIPQQQASMRLARIMFTGFQGWLKPVAPRVVISHEGYTYFSYDETSTFHDEYYLYDHSDTWYHKHNDYFQPEVPLNDSNELHVIGNENITIVRDELLYLLPQDDQVRLQFIPSYLVTNAIVVAEERGDNDWLVLLIPILDLPFLQFMHKTKFYFPYTPKSPETINDIISKYKRERKETSIETD